MEAVNLEPSNVSFSGITSSAGGSDCESILGLGGLEAYVKFFNWIKILKRAVVNNRIPFSAVCEYLKV